MLAPFSRRNAISSGDYIMHVTLIQSDDFFEHDFMLTTEKA